MKVKLIKIMLFVLFVAAVGLSGASAQLAGDYRSAIATGNWSSAASWQRYNGTSWATPSVTQGYPGQFAASPPSVIQAGTVTIQNGHAITLDDSPAQPIGALVVGGGTSGSLTAAGNRVLTVTNNATINSGATISYTGTATLIVNNLLINTNGTLTFGGTAGLTITTNLSMGTGVTFSFAGSSYYTIGGGITTDSNFTYSGSGNLTLSGSFIVNAGAIFTCSTSGDFTVNGLTSIAGTFVDNENSGTTTFNQPVTVTNTGTWTSTAITQEVRMVFNQGVTNSGTFNAGGIQMGSNGTITANALMTISSGMDTNDDLTISGTNTVSVIGDESNIGTVSAGDLTVNGTLILSGTGGAGVVDITGNLIVNGTLTFSSITQGNADIRGTTTINGSFSDTNNSGINIFYGQVTIPSGGSWTTTAITTPANLVFQNGISHSGATFLAGAATFDTNNQTLQGNNTLTFANAVTIAGIVVTNSASVSMTSTGAGVLSGTGTFTQALNSTLNYSGSTILVTNLNASASGNTLNYNAAGAQTIMTATSNRYYNLSLSGSGSKAILATMDMDGSVSIAGTAVFNVGTFNVTVGGNWVVTSTNADPFTEGTRTVTFDASVNQTITGSTTFYNLTVSKSGNVTLQGTATTSVSNILTLTTGYIVSSGTHMLSLGNSASVSGGSTNSFISGPVRKILASGGSFNFPLGSVAAARYRPATIGNTNSADTWTAQYFGYNPTTDGYANNTINATTIAKVSDREYWEISRAGTTRADVTLLYNTGSYNTSSIGNIANVRVVHWGPTQWDLPSGGGLSSQIGNTVTGTVKITNVTSFSPFTFGSLDSFSTLPVTWMFFNGEYINNEVLLTWKTATEINNDRFEVERSLDGVQFSYIGKLRGNETSNVPHFYQYTDKNVSENNYYYRLRQIDFDGKVDFSKTIIVETHKDNNQHWVAFPNPLGKEGTFQLYQNNMPTDQPVEVTLISSSGQIIFNLTGMLYKINSRLESTIATILPGVYTVKIAEGDHNEQFSIIRQ